ncbi:MAG: OmpA family protein [Cytophagales bacterium]|nr:OmpA family protein [Cytophagales bacterium]
MKYLYYIILSAITTISHAQTVQWASEVVGFSSQYSDTKWSAQQVLGKPNIMPQGGQGVCSWVPDIKEKEVSIKVRFKKPMQIRQVVVAENYHPGSIYGIIAWDSTENISKIVYDEKALRLEEKSRMLNAIFPLTDFKVAAIELLIDGKTWHTQIYIDAIGISASKLRIKAAINLPDGLKDEFILHAFQGAEKVSYKPEKLGNSINTTYLEDYPVISSDGKTLFFARANSPENIGGVKDSNDIYYSTVKNDGAWTNAVNIGAPFNNNSDNFACSISPDGNSLLLVRKYDEAADSSPWSFHRGYGLFIAKKTIDGWSAPQKQTIKKFKSNNINVEFELSDDGKYLLMSLNRDDGYGERDLYVSLVESENSWSTPFNLGPTVNTASDEISPFLAADGVSLYFSSKGFSSYGGYDIYKTIRLDDTWQNWSEPENQGPEINSDGNESCFTIPYSGDQAYFVKSPRESEKRGGQFTGSVSNSGGGASAIYRINLQDALKPYLVYSVSGIATNVLTKEPVETEVKLVCLDNNQVYGITKTNPEDGSYSFTWIFNKYCHNYSLLPTDATFFVGAMNFNISVEAEMKEITYDLPFLSLSGKAINVATKQPIVTVVRLICLDRGEIVATTKTSAKDGSYNFSLLISADCHKYSLLAADTALFPVSINFDVEQIAELKDESFDLELIPIEEKQTIRLNSIFFELGKSALQDESLPELNRMVKFMKDRPSLQIEIAGHTDNIGSHKNNHKLSHDRSKAVSDFLIQFGINKKRMHVKGYGENKPVASNDTKKGRRLNRRVEFTILKK